MSTLREPGTVEEWLALQTFRDYMDKFDLTEDEAVAEWEKMLALKPKGTA